MFSLRWGRSAGLALIVIAGAGLFLYFTRDNASAAVKLAKVERANLVSNLTTNGKVEPLEPRELRAEIPSFVRTLAVKEGDAVRGGQRLVQLEQQEAAAEVSRAAAEVQAAQAELENAERGGTSAEALELESQIKKARAERDEAARLLAINERLLQRNAVARADVDLDKERLRKAEQDLAYLTERRTKRYTARDVERARSRVAETSAALELARTRLNSAVVTSPIDGIVYSLPVKAGNFVNRGDLLARVGDLRRLRVRVYVDEPELGRLARDQEVQVTWDAYPQSSWNGKVERLPAEVSVLGTRTVGQVDCTIDNADQRLLPNINVNVEILTRRSAGALSVLKEAVVHEADDKRVVFLFEDGRLRRRQVSVGIATATRIEIRSGLDEGQLVALPSDRRLEDGMRVKSQGVAQ